MAVQHRHLVAQDGDLDVFVVWFGTETDQIEDASYKEKGKGGGHAGPPARCPSWLLRAAILYLHPSPVHHRSPLPLPCGRPYPQRFLPHPGVLVTRHQMKVWLALTRPVFPLLPRMERAPLDFSPDASDPAIASDARQGGDGS